MKKRFLIMCLINIMIIMGGVAKAEEHYIEIDVIESSEEVGVKISNLFPSNALSVKVTQEGVVLSGTDPKVSVKIHYNSKKTPELVYGDISYEYVLEYEEDNKTPKEYVKGIFVIDNIMGNIKEQCVNMVNNEWFIKKDERVDNYIVENNILKKRTICDGEIETTTTPLEDGIYHQTIKKCKECGAVIETQVVDEFTEIFTVTSEENGKELTKNEFINFRITSAYSPIKAVHIGVKDKNGQDRNGSYFGNLVYDIVNDKSVFLTSEQYSNQKSLIFNKNGKVTLNTPKDITLYLPVSILNLGENDVIIYVQVENNQEHTESGLKYTVKEEQIYETVSNNTTISSPCTESENILPLMKQEILGNIVKLVTNVEDGEEILPETKVRIEITTKTKLDQKPVSTPEIKKIYIEDENSDKILGNLIYSDIKTLEKIENGYKLEFNPSIYLKGKEQRIKFIVKVVLNNGSTYSREYIYKYEEETKIDNNTPQTIIINEPIISHDYSKKCEKGHCGKMICSGCGMHENEECGGDHDSQTCSHCKKTYCSKCENHTSCPHDEKGKCTDAHCVAANKVTYCSICNNHTHVGCNSDETCSKTNCLAKICSVCKKHECKGDKAPEVIQTNWDSVKVTCKNPNNLVTYEGVLGKSTNGQDIKRDSNVKFTITKPSDMKVELRYKSYTGSAKTHEVENSTVDLMVGTVVTSDNGRYNVDVVFISANNEEKIATYYFFIERQE